MEDTGILSDASLNAYWSGFDTNVYSAVNKMTDIDGAWAIDRVPVVLKACERLGQGLYSEGVLERVSENSRLLYQKDIKVALDVMGNLQTARGLRIFRWLEQYQPEFSAELVEAATKMNDDRSALLFIERVRVLNKLHLISRIFSYSRLRMVIDKLSDMKEQGVIDQYADEEFEQVSKRAAASSVGRISEIEDLINTDEDKDSDD